MRHLANPPTTLLPAHQSAIVALLINLKPTCPPHLRVARGLLAFHPAPDHTFHPDLLICPTETAGPTTRPASRWR